MTLERIEVPPDERLATEVALRTRWSDEDNQAVLNNAVYLTLLEEARLAYFGALGLMQPDGSFPFVLAQCHVRFVAPGRGGADVSVRLATTRVGRTSFEQAYRVREGRTGVVWCEAVALLVGWDGRARAKRELEPAFRRALAARDGLEG